MVTVDTYDIVINSYIYSFSESCAVAPIAVFSLSAETIKRLHVRRLMTYYASIKYNTFLD